ncbi:exodeoxyribonuclease VII small subunit [Comamonas sp. w2-DMI]|uniref:Exodeoxyribonuclease 7 small subunit n=1 Tax=Comamonas terrae TaxID=673548 RepID=A0ABW5US98_9BURK|nr:exodeoxyribonuclease VII small subunit [Comamonas terrae]
MPKAAASKTSAPTAALPASYEAALQELEQLIAQIESGQLPLEQMLTGYQRAAELLNFCRSKLDAVQEQVKVLDEGTLAPWSQD